MSDSSSRLLVWADHSSTGLDGLTERLAEVFGQLESIPIDPHADLVRNDTVLLVLFGSDSWAMLRWMEKLDPDDSVNVIVVVDDSHLGTDTGRDRAPVSGAAVSAVRSLAVQRGTKVRANAICVATSVSGVRTEMRGPLPVVPTVEDVVEAVSFLAGPDAAYLSGQVLYLNCGRQLFSSHTS